MSQTALAYPTDKNTPIQPLVVDNIVEVDILLHHDPFPVLSCGFSLHHVDRPTVTDEGLGQLDTVALLAVELGKVVKVVLRDLSHITAAKDADLEILGASWP